MKVITATDLPESADEHAIYDLMPKNPDPAYYAERTDRNVGWISREEQEILKNSTVGIAGLGGMGGPVAQILLRVGIGTLKISDNETFDVSNINRQFGANRNNTGGSKAFETTKELRRITDDTRIVVYPRGINEEVVDHFLEGCDIVLDEIEYWAVAARILLHQKARERNITIFAANSVGFGTRLFVFKPDSATMESCLNMQYEEAKQFEHKLVTKTATKAERIRVLGSVAIGLIPELPSYCPRGSPVGTPSAVRKRMMEEGKGPGIGTNSWLAAGFLANHMMLHLIRNSGIKRLGVKIPLAPGYLYFDSVHMRARIRKASWLRKMKHTLHLHLLNKMAEKSEKKDSRP